ncbi:MAG: hydantoinase B/oxoprolinase family protein [Planctomycetes bacterium]|nr:hydantoinase B/oxoprolinase family protein [Planctomycetota bacterium]
MRPDPVRLEVFHQLLTAICEESGAVLQRSAVSPNIRERRDFSCALFDGRGRLIAQAAHIPVHLGSAAESVAAVRRAFPLEPDDVVILNDPFAGGTHLPDLTMVRPVFVGARRRPAFFVVNRAHHADIGGAVPGSMAAATELLAEGLVLPPVKVRSAGVPVAGVLRLLLANVRGAAEREVDLAAQETSLRAAERRLLELVDAQGLRTVETYAAHLMAASERIARSVIAGLPPGVHTASDVLEDDGCGGGPYPIRVALRAHGGRLRCDFRGSARQARGGVNANRSVVLAACVYVLRCLCPDRLPTNDGLFRVLEVLTEPGSILDPRPGAAVAGGNVETSQRLVDVLLRALLRAVPERVPACSAGTMSNLSFGGVDPRTGRSFAFYETLPGGAGAGATFDGTSGVQTHMTNTRNTPLEEFERRFPVRVRAWTLRRGSGGGGRNRGGDGVTKELEVLAPLTVSLFAERHRGGPPGARGGRPGRAGRAAVLGRDPAVLPAKCTRTLEAGQVVRVETPGGGGYGA